MSERRLVADPHATAVARAALDEALSRYETLEADLAAALAREQQLAAKLAQVRDVLEKALTAKAEAVIELAQARTALDLVGQQIDLYEMSRSDTMGLDPKSTLVCIANILETGHPAGDDR